MATFYDIYQNYLQNPYSGVNAIDPVQGIGSLQVKPIVPTGGGSDSGPTFTTPTKEQSEYAMDQGMTDVGENKFGGVLSTLAGLGLSFFGGGFGKALSMGMSALNPNSIARQALASIGFNPFGSQDSITDSVDWGAVDRDQAGDPGGTSQSESEASMSEGMSDLADGGIVRKKNADGGLNYLMGY